MKFDIDVNIQFRGQLAALDTHDARVKVRELNRRIADLIHLNLTHAEVYVPEITIKEVPRLEYKEGKRDSLNETY